MCKVYLVLSARYHYTGPHQKINENGVHVKTALGVDNSILIAGRQRLAFFFFGFNIHRPSAS